jgi:CDP-diacylglycerol--glycerol-3-phosphate 3-phosphatidyltransferase
VLQATINFIVVTLMIPYTLGYLSLVTLRTISISLISLAAVYSVITAIDYIYANRGHIKKIIIQ